MSGNQADHLATASTPSLDRGFHDNRCTDRVGIVGGRRCNGRRSRVRIDRVRIDGVWVSRAGRNGWIDGVWSGGIDGVQCERGPLIHNDVAGGKKSVIR